MSDSRILLLGIFHLKALFTIDFFFLISKFTRPACEQSHLLTTLKMRGILGVWYFLTIPEQFCKNLSTDPMKKKFRKCSSCF